jgi:flagellar P-ring protein precursor FlgI
MDAPLGLPSLAAFTIGIALASAAGAAPSRIKELAQVQGVRDNELYGYGLVVGLSGTGDTERVFFTNQSIAGMLGRLGIRVNAQDVRVRNVAAVVVTARLPPFARAGTKLDVSVGAMGDARSLAGGVLVVTPLQGGDGQVHAVAQGPVQLGGYQVGSSGSLAQKNSPTSGRVPQGAMVEKPVLVDLGKGPVVLSLLSPDFTTASRIADAINAGLGEKSARAVDPAAVEVQVPEAFKADTVGLVAKIELLEVEADRRAKIVVSERTGTVVAGEGVRLRAAAVAHGGLHVTIQQTTDVSQPSPFSPQGQTTVARSAALSANEGSRGAVALPSAASVDDLAKALNALGAAPRDLVAILQALKAAGSLDADLEVL